MIAIVQKSAADRSPDAGAAARDDRDCHGEFSIRASTRSGLPEP
jgi:hypothetical protein